MKYAVVCPDGAADWPCSALGNRTPLEAASLPNLARLAAEGVVGRALHIPPGMESGSDICCMSLLGFDPAKYHTGRAPLEAKSLGVELGPDDIAVRCNTVTIEEGILADFTAGHIKTEESRQLIAALEQACGGEGLHFYPGVSYRHLLVIGATVRRQWNRGALSADSGTSLDAVCTPPHDITGKQAANHLPKGPEAGLLLELMRKSEPLFAAHPVNKARAHSGQALATQIWLWGHGRRPNLPLYKDYYGLSGGVISAVALMNSLGMYSGLESVKVPGITGYVDTNYAGKGSYALDVLARHDFVFVHIEAPDECGHQGDAPGKVKSLERIDAEIIGPLLHSQYAQAGVLRMLVCPDHPTPLSLKTHATEPVPFVAWGPGLPPNGLKFNESQARLSKIFLPQGHELMGKFLKAEL